MRWFSDKGKFKNMKTLKCDISSKKKVISANSTAYERGKLVFKVLSVLFQEKKICGATLPQKWTQMMILHFHVSISQNADVIKRFCGHICPMHRKPSESIVCFLGKKFVGLCYFPMSLIRVYRLLKIVGILKTKLLFFYTYYNKDFLFIFPTKILAEREINIANLVLQD